MNITLRDKEIIDSFLNKIKTISNSPSKKYYSLSEVTKIFGISEARFKRIVISDKIKIKQSKDGDTMYHKDTTDRILTNDYSYPRIKKASIGVEA